MANNKTTIKLLKQSLGTLNKVIEMVEEDKYCYDIIQQLQSVNGMNKKVVEVLLENHLNTCVVTKLTKDEESRESAIKELLKIYKTTK